MLCAPTERWWGHLLGPPPIPWYTGWKQYYHRSGDPFFENPITNSAARGRMGPSVVRAAELHRWKKTGSTVPRTALPETDRKSLQQESSTLHLPAWRSPSEEKEHGPFRFTREVCTIIWGSVRGEESFLTRSNHSGRYGRWKVPVTHQFWLCNQVPCMILIKLIKEEYSSKIPVCHFDNPKEDPGSNENP